ncbi:MAG: cupin domain-containing protein [Hyphomicrobiaceae bacterium]
MPQVETFWLRDDGLVPNNGTVPLVVYRAAFPSAEGSAAAIQRHFERNGWSNGWVNGIFPFHHYHPDCHEVLGVAAGSALVQFGGASGPVVRVERGDAVLVPAGVGHCCHEQTPDLVVVGAYPGGASWTTERATPEARARSLPIIAGIAPPPADPVTGASHPIWSCPDGVGQGDGCAHDRGLAQNMRSK